MASNQLGDQWWTQPGYGGAFNPGVSTGGGGDTDGHGTGGGVPGPGGAGSGTGSGVVTGGGPATTTAGTVPWYSNPSTWTNILNAIGAISGLYGLGKGSGSTPNIYPIPLSPTEQQVADSKNKLFGYASSYVDQYLKGLGNLNPGWSPSSSLLGPNGGGGFMGGVKIPTIDWSKMPPPPGTTGAGATGAPPPTGSDSDAWTAIQKYGPDAVTIAKLLADAGMPIAAIQNYIQSKFGGGNNAGGGQADPGMHDHVAAPIARNSGPNNDENYLLNRRPLV